MIGEEDYSTNLPALGRFKPGEISGVTSPDPWIGLVVTGISGEPIRFSMTESLDNIVSTAQLTLLNAYFDEGVIKPALRGEELTEEDYARFKTTSVSSVTPHIQPNAEITVTEYGYGWCTTKWRIVSGTLYEDSNGIPYCDLQLESLTQAIVDKKFKASDVGCGGESVAFVLKEYYDDALYYNNKHSVFDDYAEVITPEEEKRRAYAEDPEATRNNSDFVAENSDNIIIFSDAADLAGILFGCLPTPGSIETGSASINFSPIKKMLNNGESTWSIIQNLLETNNLMGRWKRDGSWITWKASGLPDSDDASEEIAAAGGYIPTGTYISNKGINDDANLFNPLVTTVDVAECTDGSGIKFTTSKEGVANIAHVTGYIGVYDEEGHWLVGEQSEVKITVTNPVASALLYDEEVEIYVSISPDYLFTSISQIAAYGKAELLKTILGSKGVAVESTSMPLSVEVGQTIRAASSIGSTKFTVTHLSRTTDAQQKKCVTSVTGTKIEAGGGGSSPTYIGWV